MSNGTHELKFLDRKQISVLSEALKEAVQRSREFESKLSPAEIRRLIASSIVQQALDGEKDQTRLTEEALFEGSANGTAASANQGKPRASSKAGWLNRGCMGNVTGTTP